MASKKATVLSAEYTDTHYQSHGSDTYIHFIKLDNGDSGEYHSKSKEQDKFVVGKEVEYTIDTFQVKKKDGTLMTQRDGSPWMKSRIKTVSTGGYGGKSNYVREDPKVIAREVALEITSDYFKIHEIDKTEKFDNSYVIIFADEIYKYIMEGKEDNDRIRRQAALKRMILLSGMDYYKQITSTRQSFLANTDELLKYIVEGHV